MLVCRERYTFVSIQEGTTRDGAKYLAINVIDKNSKRKFSFMTTNSLVIDEIKELEFVDFQDVDLEIKFNSVFNPDTRYSRWVPELIGVGNTNRDFE